MRQCVSTSFWLGLKRGPWPEATIVRLIAALDDLTRQLRIQPGIVGLLVFGSYARGEFTRKSDVDLLVLFADSPKADEGQLRETVLRLISELETRHRLPMHLAPLLASADPRELGAELLHDLWRDAVVLYAQAAALVRLRPIGLAPWTLFRFSLSGARPGERVRLSRRLHGLAGRPGLVRPPGLTLGRGVLLVPATQYAAVRDALDEAGASYDAIPIWREE